MHSLSEVLAWHFAPGCAFVLSACSNLPFLLSALTIPHPAGLPSTKTTRASLSPLSPCDVHSTPSVWLLEASAF